MRSQPLLAICAVAALAAPASAQKVSAPVLPTFGDTRALEGTLAGSVTLHLVGARDLTRQVRLRAPFGTDGMACAVKVGDKTIATFDTLPWEGTLDTRRFADGGYVLRLVAVDSKTGQETTLEQINVFFGNKTKTEDAKEDTRRDSAASRHLPRDRNVPPLYGLRRFSSQPIPVPPAAPTRLVPRLSLLKNARLVRATALACASERLVMGLPDGGIAVCTDAEAEKGGGTIVRLPEDAGATRAVAYQKDTIWWVTGRQDIVYRWRIGEKSLAAYDMSTTNTNADGWVRRLTPWRGQVALQGDAVCRILKLDGTLADLSDDLPPDVAELTRSNPVRLADYGDRGAWLAVLEPTVGETPALHLYGTSGSNADLAERLTVPIARNAPLRLLALSAEGMATLDPTPGGAVQGWLVPKGKGEAAQPPELRIGWGGTIGGSLHARQISIGGSGIWVGADGVLFHTDIASGHVSAYLPWNGAGNVIRDLVADTTGVWVVTDTGVCHITPLHADPQNGFGGYVRARLGTDTDTPRTSVDQTALAAAEDWQGVPYLWGGQTKSGTDCSGYVGAIHHACGVDLPRTSSDMGTTKMGKRVHDELQWGDTLVYPGHVAFYIGNGQTAETTEHQVGKATIWRRKTVIVRRFLH